MTTSIDDDTSTATSTVGAAAETSPAPEADIVTTTWTRAVARRWRLLAAIGFLAISIAVAAVVYFGPHRDDRQSAAAAGQALAAAQQGAVALLSYAPDSLDRDLTDARSHLTGDFLTYYSQFADQILTPAAKQKDVHATATVVRAAVMNAHPDTAQVLLFINQETTSRDNPTPAQAASSVKVGLTRADDTWRISSFDPA